MLELGREEKHHFIGLSVLGSELRGGRESSREVVDDGADGVDVTIPFEIDPPDEPCPDCGSGHHRSCPPHVPCICEMEQQLNPDCPLHGITQPNPECVYCHGSGAMDSGGETPWGAPIDVRCVCTYPEPV